MHILMTYSKNGIPMVLGIKEEGFILYPIDTEEKNTMSSVISFKSEDHALIALQNFKREMPHKHELFNKLKPMEIKT